MIRFSMAGTILIAMISSFAVAQDPTPKVQVFGGYSLMHTISGEASGPTLDLDLHQFPNTFGVTATFNGWNAEGQYNLSRWVGIAVDFGGRNGTPITTPGPVSASGVPTLTAYSFLFGPVVSYRTKSRMTPFAHALVGWDRETLSASTVNGLSSPVSSSATTSSDFAIALGGGIDCKLSHRFALRLAQVDYFHTSLNLNNFYGDAFGPALFQGFKTRQVNLRVSAGIVVKF